MVAVSRNEPAVVEVAMWRALLENEAEGVDNGTFFVVEVLQELSEEQASEDYSETHEVKKAEKQSSSTLLVRYFGARPQ